MGSLDNEYYDKKIINIKKYLNEKNLQILEKLGIRVEDKIYTAFEYEIFAGEVSKYYKEDDYSKEDLEFVEIKEMEKENVKA